MDAYGYLLLYNVAISLLSSGNFSAGRVAATDGSDIGKIGAVFDCSSRVGKEQRVAMEMAVEDLNNEQYEKLSLGVKCSSGNDAFRAAQAARHLIVKNGVQAIVGPNSWEESSAVAEIASQSAVPILSLSEAAPSQATHRWPLFVQASPSVAHQMKAVAAIIESCRWSAVNVIYEDSGSAASNGLVNHLFEAFQGSGIEMKRLVALPYFASWEMLHEELVQLNRASQCRVFVVHAGLSLAERVFRKAEEMKMMESQYVWITTDSTSSLMHSMNTSVISSMQGVLGVRRYFPDTGQRFNEFNTKFTESFRQKHPEERNHEPGIFALQAYDIILALGSAITAGSKDGPRVLERIDKTDVVGLSGRIKFKERKLVPTDQFQIINVYGRSYRVAGCWSTGRGFSKRIDSEAESSASMAILGNMFWPGGPSDTPTGWDPSTSSNPLKIGVPCGSVTNAFVKCDGDRSMRNNTVSGYSIEVFKKAVDKLRYPLHYEFVPHWGNYNELVKQVHAKNFDAAVGDIATVSERYEYVEFTHAHTEAGVVMVVPIDKHANRAWLFLRPFTMAMWLLTGLVSVYNGFVIWSIERNFGPDLHQTGTFVWLAFGANGERLHSNLSKMAATVWVFMALIITQSYTASLSSMLTMEKIEPKIANVETLLNKKALIGCSKLSFVKDYLEQTLHFNNQNVRNFTTLEQYSAALRNGEISAAFLESPVAKLFVARYCKSFTIANPTYKVGGYGFAFPKGSSLTADMDEALLNVFETGELKGLESSLIESEKCVDQQGDNNTVGSLSPQSFTVLFLLSGGTSTAALVIYHFRRKMEVGSNSNSMGDYRGILWLIYMVLEKWRYRRSRLSRKVSDVECPTSDPNSLPNRGVHENVDSVQQSGCTH